MLCAQNDIIEIRYERDLEDPKIKDIRKRINNEERKLQANIADEQRC